MLASVYSLAQFSKSGGASSMPGGTSVCARKEEETTPVGMCEEKVMVDPSYLWPEPTQRVNTLVCVLTDVASTAGRVDTTATNPTCPLAWLGSIPSACQRGRADDGDSDAHTSCSLEAQQKWVSRRQRNLHE